MTDKEILQNIGGPYDKDNIFEFVFTEDFLLPWSKEPTLAKANIRNRLSVDVSRGLEVAIVWIIRYLLYGDLDAANEIKDILIKDLDITVEDLNEVILRIANLYKEELTEALEAYNNRGED